MTDDEQAIQCAADQAALDFPYAEVTNAEVFRKIVNEDRKLTQENGRVPTTTSDRWYVDLTLQHREDESIASALYRVWRTPDGFQAIKVKIV